MPDPVPDPANRNFKFGSGILLALKGTGTRDLIWLKVVSLDRSWLVLGRIWLCAPYVKRVLHGKICAKFRTGIFQSVAALANIVGHSEISIFTCICLNLQKYGNVQK